MPVSRPTPRRTRQPQHTRHPSNPNLRPMPTSDYESDAANYHTNNPPSQPPPPHRTNTELNLGVLRRHVPSVSTIVSISANAVIYAFDAATHAWDKSGVEGTLFVCSLDDDGAPSPSGDAHRPPAVPRFCVFVLNRRSLDNLKIDLVRVRDCEVTDDLLILALEEEEGAGADGAGAAWESSGNGDHPAAAATRTLGIWMHADGEDSRKVNMNIIHGLWEQVRGARRQAEQAEGHGGGVEGDHQQRQGLVEAAAGEPAAQAMGQPLSVDDLFASQAGFGR